MNRPFRLRGFTLLEIIISVSIIVLLAGITVPMTATIMRAARKDATAKRLDAIGKATYQYFEDTMTFPTALTDLNADNGVAGWAGPYMLDYFYASNPEAKDFGLDDFGTPIQFGTPTPTSTTIVSLGADHTENTADDIVQSVNVLPVLRSVTQANVDTLNAAITAYNRNRTDTTPALPSNLNSAFNTLVSDGYLPNNSTLKFDAWGDALVPTSSAGSPLVAVTSENLEAGSATNSSGSISGNPASGTAKGKGKGSGSSGKGKKSGGNSGGSTPGTGTASGSGNGSSNSSPGSNKKGTKGKGKGKSTGNAGNGNSQQNEDSGGDHAESDHDEDDDHGDSSTGENPESEDGDSHGGESSHGGDSQDHGNSSGSNSSAGETGSNSGSSNDSNTQSGDGDDGGSGGGNSNSKKSGGGGSGKKSGKTKGSGKKSSGG